jgi:FKBP-type peptidyl-prolyl cis-trans isomerase 2
MIGLPHRWAGRPGGFSFQWENAVIQKGASVRIHYKLQVDGQVIDSSEGGDPLGYVQGNDEIIPGLEAEIGSMEVGESRSVTLAPEDAYGLPNPERKQEVHKEAFPNADDLTVGDQVSGQAGGRPILATVAEIGDESITLDMNHPLAGKTLEFEVDLVSVE